MSTATTTTALYIHANGDPATVLELARAWGLRTINLIRDRKDFDATKQALLDLGATAVLRDQTNELADFSSRIMSVGTKVSAVLYSMVSGDPAPAIPIGDVIFRELKLFGFWSRSGIVADIAVRQAMNEGLVTLLREGKIKSPAVEQVVVPSDGRAVDKGAVQRVAGELAGYRGKKDLIVFQH
ncbi:mitochondrial 2-enoyl thioester reductase [Allomyces arbusculus]|nr:mitochondrial 2-enoyl thioester reductase [Allomyces arbusculus]